MAAQDNAQEPAPLGLTAAGGEEGGLARGVVGAGPGGRVRAGLRGAGRFGGGRPPPPCCSCSRCGESCARAAARQPACCPSPRSAGWAWASPQPASCEPEDPPASRHSAGYSPQPESSRPAHTDESGPLGVDAEGVIHCSAAAPPGAHRGLPVQGR